MKHKTYVINFCIIAWQHVWSENKQRGKETSIKLLMPFFTVQIYFFDRSSVAKVFQNEKLYTQFKAVIFYTASLLL